MALVLSHFSRLQNRLSELPEVESISDHDSEVRTELCKLFLAECGEARKREIYQKVFETDVITDRMIDFHEDKLFGRESLLLHIGYTVHDDVEETINSMLNQVERG